MQNPGPCPCSSSDVALDAVEIVAALAEITRHQDREGLHQCLAAALRELFPQDDFQLYQVLVNDGCLRFTLLLSLDAGQFVPGSSSPSSRLPKTLLGAIQAAAACRDIVSWCDARGGASHLVYPAFDREDALCSVLVQRLVGSAPVQQQLMLGLFHVYSNYLNLLDQSNRDKLTGLLNRETLDTEVTRMLVADAECGEDPRRRQRRESDGWHHWFALIDIDFFKRINDGWGHLYGDEVLILLSRLLGRIFRSEDAIFRYGGEEFAVVFRTHGPVDAERVCERARATVAAHTFPAVGTVTVSIGYTEIRGQAGTAIVIDQADRALYFSKEHGRNQVHAFAALVERGLIQASETTQSSEVEFF